MLEELLKDPKVFYIYRKDKKIYGLPDEDSYTIIVEDNYAPEVGDNDRCVFVSRWFEMVADCTLDCWKAACLKGPKNILKEAVKLLMTTDVVKLYDNIMARWPKEDATTDELWGYYNDVRLTNQIIENHKIVNFKSGASDYSRITSYDAFLAIIKPHMEELRMKGKDQSDYAAKQRIEAKIKAGTLKPRNAKDV